MEGTTPLIRSLPETLDDDTKGSLVRKDEEVDADLPERRGLDSDLENMESVSGNILRMFSSSLTTSDMDGRCSGLSWQHLSAKVTNLSTHSDG